jgi:hypothetical protein
MEARFGLGDYDGVRDLAREHRDLLTQADAFRPEFLDAARLWAQQDRALLRTQLIAAPKTGA